MTDGYSGLQTPQSAGTQFNQMSFLVQSLINKMATVAYVKVIAVDGATVAVQPMVSQTTGDGTGIAHGTIYKIPYIMLQAGTSAVILKPVVGDIGVILCASHDSSVVKSTKDFALPGSRRRFDWADGIYLGGVLNAEPARFVKIDTDGITITDPGNVTINAPQTSINGDLSVSGSVDIGGDNSVGGNLSVGGNSTLGMGATKYVMLADMMPSTTVKAK